MTHAQTMVKVVIPQVLQNILPSISNEFVINIKDTSVLNVIGVTELYYMAGVIKRINLQTFQVYTVICVLYFILTFTVTRLLRLAEKKLAGSDSYTICGSGSDSVAACASVACVVCNLYAKAVRAGILKFNYSVV